jgi:hypothetical protein
MLENTYLESDVNGRIKLDVNFSQGYEEIEMYNTVSS